MTAESALKWLLRFMCFTTLFAFFAAVMPQSWLVHWINKGAPGTPVGILVTYLARMLMIMYAFVGLEFLIVSADIPRYLPLIWILGVGTLILAPVGLIVLFTQVPPEQRNAMFWVVFVDFAEGLAQANSTGRPAAVHPASRDATGGTGLIHDAFFLRANDEAEGFAFEFVELDHGVLRSPTGRSCREFRAGRTTGRLHSPA